MSIPMSETSLSEQDRSLEFPRVKFQRDKDFMIIELKKYNEIQGTSYRK